MAKLHCRLTPLAAYLLLLATYSTFMFISTLESDLSQSQDDAAQHSRSSTHHHHLGHSTNRRTHRLSKRSEGQVTLHDVDDFFNKMKQLETTCNKLVSMGGTSCRKAMDNDKYVCLDDDVSLTPRNCTVYSFGIGADTTFDDQMNFFGCDIFMFDPTVNKNRIVSTNYKREQFYLLGVDVRNFSAKFNLTYLDPDDNEVVQGEFDTYDNIRARLGHQDRVVEYLKLDIESTEWRVLPYMLERGLLAGVRQIAIEVHTTDITTAPQHKVVELLQGYWRILEGLTRQGFLRANYRPTLVYDSLYHVPGENRTIPTCFEVLYIRRGPIY